MLHHSAHIGGGMCIVTHGWAHDAPWCATERRRVLCSSQYVFFMSQGGLEPCFRFQRGWEPGFRFLVSGAPLLCPPESGVTSPQGGGGYDKRNGENGKRKTENSSLIARLLPLSGFYRPLRRFAPPLRAPTLNWGV